MRVALAGARAEAQVPVRTLTAPSRAATVSGRSRLDAAGLLRGDHVRAVAHASHSDLSRAHRGRSPAVRQGGRARLWRLRRHCADRVRWPRRHGFHHPCDDGLGRRVLRDVPGSGPAFLGHEWAGTQPDPGRGQAGAGSCAGAELAAPRRESRRPWTRGSWTSGPEPANSHAPSRGRPLGRVAVGDASAAVDSLECPGGGTGRHVRLRGVWGNPCEFKSRPGHHE